MGGSIDILGPQDIGGLLALQERVLSRDGPDRIWTHRRTDLEALFGTGDDFLAIGVRKGDELVAASLSRRTRPAEVSPLTPTLKWTAGEVSHIGLNTLSMPGPGGAPQMIRLLRARRDLLARRGVDHLFGGIRPDHPISLGCAFRAGAVGVGHLAAEGCIEILLWNGPGLDRWTPQIRDRSSAQDLARQAHILRGGLVAVGLDPEDRSTILFSHPPKECIFR
jgi:hypothetical protein